MTRPLQANIATITFSGLIEMRYTNKFRKNVSAFAISAAALSAIICFQSSAAAQSKQRPDADVRPSVDARSSAAYAEVLLKKTQVQADLDALTADYTDDFPKVAEMRYMLETVEKERLRLLAVKPADLNRLTPALGKLMIGKIEAEVDLWSMRRSMQEAHPDVKRAKRKVEIFESAIKEIL